MQPTVHIVLKLLFIDIFLFGNFYSTFSVRCIPKIVKLYFLTQKWLIL